MFKSVLKKNTAVYYNIYVSDYNANGTGFAPHKCCPLIGSPSLDEFWSMTGKQTAAGKGAGHPISLCFKPRMMVVATCPSATHTKNIFRRRNYECAM